MMKMSNFKDISWLVSEEEYRKDPAYSYSTISKFNREGFNSLSTLFDRVESPSLLFGSMVDTLLTGGQEEFDSLFIVAELPQISDSLELIAKELFKQCKDIYSTFDEIPDETLSNVALSCNYYMDKKYYNYRVKQVKENCKEYYNLSYLTTSGKTLVSTKNYKDAQECVDILKSHDNTRHIFMCSNPFEVGIERLYQLKFKGDYTSPEGTKIALRCMADLIIVDHTTKTVTPYDLKTSFKKEWDFHKSFLQWGY